MKTNTRYLFTVYSITIGIWAIKSLYFQYLNKSGMNYILTNNLELNSNFYDYDLIGASSGLYASGQICIILIKINSFF